jgi:hypothetical protein
MDKVEMIKTFDGFYTPEQQAFLNSLDIVTPLDGVMIKVSEDCLLERTIKKSAILYIDAENTLIGRCIGNEQQSKRTDKRTCRPYRPKRCRE